MNRITKIIILFALLLLVAVPAALAQDEEPAVPPNSISGMIADKGRFSTMEAAMEAAGLTEMFSGGEWTLFTPTNQAFAKLGLSAKNITKEYSSEQLKDMILYHTLSGRLSTADLKIKQGNVTMQNGGQAGIKFYKGRIYVNDDSKVTGDNVAVDNGYMQIVDTVIQPPWPRVEAEAAGQVQESAEGQVQAAAGQVQGQVQEGTEGQVQGQVQTAPEGQVQETIEGQVQGDEAPQVPTVPENSIAGIAAVDGRFDTLIAAALAAGMVDDLGSGQWTLFAPTDEAFAKMGLNADNVAAEYDANQLKDMLLYHLLSGSNTTADLKTKLGNVNMANGRLAGLKYYEDYIYVNDDSKVIEKDIIADNGRIQVVDTVVQPPWPRVSEPLDLTGGQVQGQVQEAAAGQVQ